MSGVRKHWAGASKSRNLAYYQRSPFLISYWAGPLLAFENSLKGSKLAGEGLISDVLAFCSQPRTLAEICAQFPKTSQKELREAILRMEKDALLEQTARRAVGQKRAWVGWESWSPAASYFHFSTKDVKYARGDVEDFRHLRKLAQEQPLPSRRKALRGAKRIQFSRAGGGGQGEFVRVLEARRTWREFSKEPLVRPQIEELLRFSFGVQGWAKIAGVGRLALKTSPSGGALHPLEAYVAIRRVRGVGEGLYHYDAEGHGLQLVRTGIKKGELETMLAGQYWFCDAAMIVFLTAVFARSQWKYANSRAYRVVLAEAGHVCQTFCLTATWLGLAPFCTMAFADSKIEKALRVDGVEESVVYVMGVGARPERPATADRLRVK
jgi:SagB-type dehydrogenase family enzyme